MTHRAPKFRRGATSFYLVRGRDVSRATDREHVRKFLAKTKRSGSADENLNESELDELAEGIASGELRLVRVRSKPPLLDAPKVQNLADLAEPEVEPLREAPKKASTFYEVQFTTRDDRLIPGVRVSIQLPDGTSRRGTTNASGVLRIDSIEGEGSVGARAELPKPLDTREGALLQSAKLMRVPTPSLLEDGLSFELGRSYRVVVESERKVTCAKLSGALFSHAKTLLLPEALEGIRLLAHMYEDMPGAEVLVVGHTDTSGPSALNNRLSVERAKAVIAYLQDDVDAWLKYYESEVGGSKRWGPEEDLVLLSALPDPENPFYGEHHESHDLEAAVKRFQEAKGLVVDGIAGPNTRRALITDYMAADGTSLPQDVRATAHGCGESFLAKPTDDGVQELANRRVEVFFFQEGINPPPAGEVSGPDASDYPAWLDAVEEERTFTPGALGVGTLLISTDIETEFAQDSGVTFILRSTNGLYLSTLRPHEHGRDAGGFVTLLFEDMPRTAFYSLFATYEGGESERPLFEDIPYAELGRISKPPEDSLVDPFEDLEAEQEEESDGD